MYFDKILKFVIRTKSETYLRYMKRKRSQKRPFRD